MAVETPVDVRSGEAAEEAAGATGSARAPLGERTRATNGIRASPQLRSVGHSDRDSLSLAGSLADYCDVRFSLPCAPIVWHFPGDA